MQPTLNEILPPPSGELRTDRFAPLAESDTTSPNCKRCKGTCRTGSCLTSNPSIEIA